jgi:hypothetical protein
VLLKLSCPYLRFLLKFQPRLELLSRWDKTHSKSHSHAEGVSRRSLSVNYIQKLTKFCKNIVTESIDALFACLKDMRVFRLTGEAAVIWNSCPNSMRVLRRTRDSKYGFLNFPNISIEIDFRIGIE